MPSCLWVRSQSMTVIGTEHYLHMQVKDKDICSESIHAKFVVDWNVTVLFLNVNEFVMKFLANISNATYSWIPFEIIEI